MTREEAIRRLKEYLTDYLPDYYDEEKEALDMAIKALEQKSIDKSAMMHEIYMEGVNMGGEYQGCWVRFKNIEKIIDKYIAESEGEQ